jgi:hypothetical protein
MDTSEELQQSALFCAQVAESIQQRQYNKLVPLSTINISKTEKNASHPFNDNLIETRAPLEKILGNIYNIISSKNLREIFNIQGNAFTKKRILPLDKMILIMLHNGKSNIQTRLNRYFLQVEGNDT